MPPAGTTNANSVVPIINTSNASPPVAPINTHNTNSIVDQIDTTDALPQQQSPLFGRIPGEIRDQIFDLALTAYPGKQEPFEKNAYYYRPGFRYADQRLDTALLRTCRRIYQEACLVPLQNYERVEWYKQDDRGPSAADARRFARGGAFCPWVTSLHLFAQQYWLEDSSWRNYSRRLGANKTLRRLKITIRHSDWWWWESSDRLALDAKQKGTASATRHSTASDAFNVNSWGHKFWFFTGLEEFALELETVEGKRTELDAIVVRAADWRFPLGDGNILALNPARIKRTGWQGVKLREYIPSAELNTRGNSRSRTDGTDSTGHTCTQRPQRSQGETREGRRGLRNLGRRAGDRWRRLLDVLCGLVDL